MKLQGVKSLVGNLENTSIQGYSGNFDNRTLDCIKAHQEALSERVSKFIEENEGVYLKTLNFYINMGEAVLQYYLTGIGSTYKSDVLLKKSKECAETIAKFLSREGDFTRGKVVKNENSIAAVVVPCLALKKRLHVLFLLVTLALLPIAIA